MVTIAYLGPPGTFSEEAAVTHGGASAAYLPLVDGGRYVVTLAAAGGLVARPADDATARKIADAAAP